LRARPAHCWAFSTVQDAKLDTGQIGGAAHEAIERVNFPHEVTFSKAANRRIARHSSDGFELVGYQGRLSAHAGSSRCGFAAGMAAANHHDVESTRHLDLGAGVLPKARGGVKTSVLECFT
jgi:hypothetical protein